MMVPGINGNPSVVLEMNFRNDRGVLLLQEVVVEKNIYTIE